MVSSMTALREVLKFTTATWEFGGRGMKLVTHNARSFSSGTLGSKETRALRDTYKNKFLPRTYADQYGRYIGEGVPPELKILHNIFQSDLVQGNTLLDLGSGPVVANVLLGSSRCNHIVMSDLVETNRLELMKWLNKDEDALDWTFRAEKVAEAEGYTDLRKGALEIIERTRLAVRKVVPCDVLEPGVLPEEHRQSFDVIISSGCLESATADHESFRKAVCNVGTLTKPGGLLVLVGAGGVKSYPVGDVAFAHANITEKVVEKAIKDAGFQMEIYHPHKTLDLAENPNMFTFVLAARKA
ncbi:indolethylamine N-methyltransferase-like [Ixodes scapularis]|uniref:indolethylamine N-methyltransferase-like n=1 Tax=Ixodes scapularis TaxID=6945 RepID=UPI001A9E3FDE|nr:indolethylamine N-methyltransferase-like [Ixodes scapularis]